jgi:acetate kinase
VATCGSDADYDRARNGKHAIATTEEADDVQIEVISSSPNHRTTRAPNMEAGRDSPSVLAINGGSSSIRFALYAAQEPLRRLLDGKVDRVGLSGTNLVFKDSTGTPQDRETVAVAGADHRSAVAFLLDWLETRPVFASVKAVGHRVVHGMTRAEPERVTPELLDALRSITPYDPEHLPLELELMEAFHQRHPTWPQVACFDTAFHRTMPRVARLLPIPRRYDAKGIQRYGFHGLSYAYLIEELARLGDPAAETGRVILAHLGNGASMAAVHDGKSIDTSMGFTPTAGLVMSTRSGDLDPGVAPYLARTEQMTSQHFYDMASHESGLLGVSEISSDLQDLLAAQDGDVRAAEAVALFCYQAKRWIGSFSAVLGGLDTLVFAGGIGENAPLVRARICEGLSFLGVDLDLKRNAKNAPLISPDAGRVQVRVIRTDEELMIVRSVARVLRLGAIHES